MPSEPLISLPRVSGFVNQLTHDMRNDLNSLALGLDLLGESFGDPQAQEVTSRLHNQIRSAGARLREISIKLADTRPNRVAISARELFLIWQEQGGELKISGNWNGALGDEMVNVDVNGVAKALRELLLNAKQFGKGAEVNASAVAIGSQVVFELREATPAPVNPAGWGDIPFCSTQRGHYGLGLWEADRLVRASGGEILREGLPDSQLVTKFTFQKEPPEGSPAVPGSS